ncbi:sugar transferase [Listeria kieliensis]|nr:sugar transferase [Listeria kieliensis]
MGKPMWITLDKQHKSYLSLKRIFDIHLSMLGLLFLSPLLILIAALIKCSDWKGKVLFKQIRLGKDGEEFWMYKFRTMHHDAEAKLEELKAKNEISGAMFKMKEDPRVTKIGKFLRKSSLDELPQLWNVLKGDMSLVGPRPPLLREVSEYTPYQIQRLLVKPGCTGIWQVSGRNSLDFYQMVELDLEYIRDMSFYLDVKIICKTIIVMVVPNNAY